AKQGKDLARLLSELLNHFRNLLIFQVSKGDMRILEVSETEAATLQEQSAALSSDALTRIMEVLTDCEGRLRDAASKKILIEVALLKAIEARNAVSIDTVLKQLQQMRSGNITTAAPIAAAPTRSFENAAQKVQPKASEPVRQVSASPIETPVAPAHQDLEQLWTQLVESIGRASPFVRAYFVEAHPVSFAKNVLTIGFDPEFSDHIALVDNSRNHTLVQTKLSEMGYSNSQVKFVKAEAPAHRMRIAEPAPAPVSAPAKAESISPLRPSLPSSAAREIPAATKTKTESVPFNRDDFKNDPLIQKALEIFKGQIVDVRS
ncbi:MAG: DNA polymerase III subunit gamma/tau, partial [Verrucomicrobiota bacterium]